MPILMCIFLSTTAKTPEFTNEQDTIVSTYGHFTLTWDNDLDLDTFELEESKAIDFSDSRVVYQGVLKKLFLSGKNNGLIYYRVRSLTDGENPSWSKPIVVQVQHQSLSLAWKLFAVGAVVFGIVVVVVVVGAKQESNNE